MNSKILNGVLLVFALFVCTLFSLTLAKYSGKSYVYILFSLILNTLLFFGFRKGAIFFDTFIGLFFWLGFWFKFSFKIAFTNGEFYEAARNFSYTGAAFDRALFIASCGTFGFLVFSLIREKYIFSYPNENNKIGLEGLFNFYKKYRKLIWLSFFILFVAIAITNAYFGIYQRGTTPRTILPYRLGGIYTWLLLFGAASISSLILNFEFIRYKKTSYPVVLLSLLESFFSSVSMLSRGMVLNASALIIGVVKNFKLNSIFPSIRFVFISLFTFLFLFASSVWIVQQMRMSSFFGTSNPKLFATNTKLIFIERWVGIEAVMAVSSYPELGWDLWNTAWKEKYSNYGTSFYDSNIITSPYRHLDLDKHHFVSVPGILAFFFYPGSFLFLFFSMFILAALGAGIEISIYKLSESNVILCSLFAQVVAYRYAHFGYVPKQSYLLFGTIYLNLFLIFLANKFLLYWNKE